MALVVKDTVTAAASRGCTPKRRCGSWRQLCGCIGLQGGALWIGTQPRNEPNGAPGWLMKLDRESGRVLGVVESTGHHSVAVTPDGELLTGTRPDKVLWFRRK